MAYVNAEFHGRPLRCMLDTGCDRSVIGSRLLAREKLSPSGYSLTAAGQNPLKVNGDVHIQFSIEGASGKSGPALAGTENRLVV